MWVSVTLPCLACSPQKEETQFGKACTRQHRGVLGHVSESVSKFQDLFLSRALFRTFSS